MYVCMYVLYIYMKSVLSVCGASNPPHHIVCVCVCVCECVCATALRHMPPPSPAWATP